MMICGEPSLIIKIPTGIPKIEPITSLLRVAKSMCWRYFKATGTATIKPKAPIKAVEVCKSKAIKASNGMVTRASPNPKTVRIKAPNRAIKTTIK